MFDATREKTRLWLLILVGVVATLLGQTHAREIFTPSPQESGVFATATQATTGNFYDANRYDAPDSLLAAKTVAPTVEQYTLRAVDSGFYPVLTRGSKAPTGITWLEKGDVWKFGTTKNPTTRYSDSFLRNTGDHGLRYSTEWQGTIAEALQLERMKIQNFLLQSGGKLPAGNKIVR